MGTHNCFGNARKAVYKLSTTKCLLPDQAETPLAIPAKVELESTSIDPQRLSKSITVGSHQMTSAVDGVMVLQQGLLLKSGQVVSILQEKRGLFVS